MQKFPEKKYEKKEKVSKKKDEFEKEMININS